MNLKYFIGSIVCSLMVSSAVAQQVQLNYKNKEAQKYINEEFDTKTPAENKVHFPLKYRLGPVTPTTIPGGKVVNIDFVKDSVTKKNAIIIFADWAMGVGENTKVPVIPGSKWFPTMGIVGPDAEENIRPFIDALKNKYGADVPIIVYCQFPHSWLGYNASLRLINAGFKNVMWFRGGLFSWIYHSPTLAIEEVYKQNGVQWLLDSSKK